MPIETAQMHPSVQRLLSRLDSLGITRAEFRAKFDIDTRVFNNWIKRGIPQRKIMVFAKFLEMNPEYLQKGHGPIEANWVEATLSMPVSMGTAREKTPPTLVEEKKLLKAFRSLTNEDRQRLLIFADALNKSKP